METTADQNNRCETCEQGMLPNSSFESVLHNCTMSTGGTVTIMAYTIANTVFLLPLYIFVLYLGLQRWQIQRSRTTNSNIFTYHMIGIEIMTVLACILTLCGITADNLDLLMAGTYMLIINSFGQTLFHLLTCVDRYIAVVHPVTYMNLRKAKWIRIANMTSCCVWLLCFAGTLLLNVKGSHFFILSYALIFLSLIVITFCSVHVLYVLTHPAPGKGVERKQKIPLSKLRAFHTILIILGVLLFRFVGNILTNALFSLPQLGEVERCFLWFSVVWFLMPSSLVLPLLFLQQAGKLRSCKKNIKSEQGSE